MGTIVEHRQKHGSERHEHFMVRGDRFCTRNLDRTPFGFEPRSDRLEATSPRTVSNAWARSDTCALRQLAPGHHSVQNGALPVSSRGSEAAASQDGRGGRGRHTQRVSVVPNRD